MQQDIHERVLICLVGFEAAFNKKFTFMYYFFNRCVHASVSNIANRCMIVSLLFSCYSRITKPLRLKAVGRSIGDDWNELEKNGEQKDIGSAAVFSIRYF